MFKLFHGEKTRFQHFCALGMKKTGKSTLLGNMALNDIEREDGVILFDNQGSLADAMIERIKVPRRDVYYLDCTHKFYPMGFNIFEQKGTTEEEKKRERELITKYFYDFLTGHIGEFEDKNFKKLLEKLISTALEICMTPYEVFETLNSLERHSVIEKRMEKLPEDLKDFWKKDIESIQANLPEEVKSELREKLKPLLNDAIVKKTTEERVSTLDLFDQVKKGRVLIMKAPEEEMGELATRVFLESVMLKLKVSTTIRNEFGYNKTPMYIYLNEFPYFESNLLDAILEGWLTAGEDNKVSLNLSKESRGKFHEHSTLVKNCRVLVFFRLQEDDASYVAENHLKDAHVETEDLTSLNTAQVVLYLLNENDDRIVMQATTTPMPEMKQLHNYQAILERSIKARSRGLIELARSFR